MDDPRTRQSIDDLAAHYLTGVTAPPAAPNGTDPIIGPAPIRLAPKPAHTNGNVTHAAATSQRPAAEAIRPGGPGGHDDGHPILRLTDAEADAPNTPGVTVDQAPTGEPRAAQANAFAVVLGNLPGLSGPWLTQYAQLIAQRQGPVAVLHVDDEVIDLEIVEPRLEAAPYPRAQVAATRVPPSAGEDGLVGLLDALVRAEQTPVRTVLVRLHAEPDAMSASRLGALDQWTVLCGADDAAVVACYSMLKRVVEHEPRNAGKHVSLMVMGSDEDAAKRAAQKVTSTADSFLSTPVELAGHLRQMQPVSVRQMGTFPDPVALWPRLVAWLETLETPTNPPMQQSAARTEPFLEPVITTPTPAPPPRAAPPAPAAHTVAPRQEPIRESAPSAPRTAKPVSENAAADNAQPVDDLFALLAQGPAAIPGGLALDARVPAAPAIQLAVDSEGVVHLLMHHGLADDPRRAVPEMMEARRWVTEQHALLALTQRDHTFADPIASPPVMHLFTDRAERATTLVARLGDALRLHLLQKVTLGRETGWFCTPLN